MQTHLAKVAFAFTVVLLEVVNASYCDIVTQRYSPKDRYLSVNGAEKNISLYWGSEPAHAAATLLAVVLKYAHGYHHVRLLEGPHSLQDLAVEISQGPHGGDDDVILAISTAREARAPASLSQIALRRGISGLSLQEFGESKVPGRLRLHMWVATSFRHSVQCQNATHWRFFTNATELIECGFTSSSASLMKKAMVYKLDSSSRTNILVERLEKRANKSQMILQFGELDRKSFFRMLRENNQSFLFVDYDIWKQYPGVSVVQLPPCVSNKDSTCSRELDTATVTSIADVYILYEYAIQLYNLAHIFAPPLESLIFILEQNANEKNIEEVACEWVLNNHDMVTKSWVTPYEYNKRKYEIAVFYCANDQVQKFESFLYRLHYEVNKLSISSFRTRFRSYPMACFNSHFVNNEIYYYMIHEVRQRLIGAVVGGVKNIIEVTKGLDGNKMPVLLYDAAGVDANATNSVWLSTGRSLHLAFALKHFIHSIGWTRVAVLSEQTRRAQRYIDDIHEVGGFHFRNHFVQLNLSRSEAKSVLQKLKYENARVILLNMNYENAVTILSEATELGMNVSTDYAWIVYDWQPNNLSLNIKYFTISFCCQSSEDITNSNWPHLREKINQLWPENAWPSQAAAIADAVLTLVYAFQDVLLQYPQARDDIRSTEANQQFERSFTNINPVMGFTQNLTYKGHSLEDTLVYLDEWHGSERTRLARWQVNVTSRKVHDVHSIRKVYSNHAPPDDGASRCIASYGDPYLPSCYDTSFVIALLTLIMVAPAFVIIYRTLRRRLQQYQKKVLLQILARREQRAATLSAGYLIDRSALEIRNELGSGRFGCVRLAVLNISSAKPRFVAAKGLRDTQDESELLREACTLASLDHDNIIRLVGVCIDDEPPLVLMEVAFFGDLLQYLQSRRFLAEGAASEPKLQLDKNNEEAVHVSAESLTRLARQAASALGYLSLHGVIHRDLRASNCLVDANRSLKLADFGLAREMTAAGVDGGGEYACRRRGLFPVLWMAPESLVHGVFSAASDVWAFGVLVFELVTLGSRPYGDMSPLRVMQFVAAGGKPPMPRDATPSTTALAHLCWQRKAEQRPTAAAVVAYLAERPNALSPAFDSYEEQPTDADSGYGDSTVCDTLLPA